MSYHDPLETSKLWHDCRSVFEFYAQGSSYETLHTANRQNESLWHRYIKDTSFRFLVTAYNHTIPQSRQRDVIESFAYMGFLGKIDMKTPDIILTCFEECAYIFILQIDNVSCHLQMRTVMELREKNMKEMVISDKYSLVGWYVHRNN